MVNCSNASFFSEVVTGLPWFGKNLGFWHIALIMASVSSKSTVDETYSPGKLRAGTWKSSVHKGKSSEPNLQIWSSKWWSSRVYHFTLPWYPTTNVQAENDSLQSTIRLAAHPGGSGDLESEMWTNHQRFYHEQLPIIYFLNLRNSGHFGHFGLSDCLIFLKPPPPFGANNPNKGGEFWVAKVWFTLPLNWRNWYRRMIRQIWGQSILCQGRSSFFISTSMLKHGSIQHISNSNNAIS